MKIPITLKFRYLYYHEHSRVLDGDNFDCRAAFNMVLAKKVIHRDLVSQRTKRSRRNNLLKIRQNINSGCGNERQISFIITHTLPG